jgi:hypothetical protein
MIFLFIQLITHISGCEKGVFTTYINQIYKTLPGPNLYWSYFNNEKVIDKRGIILKIFVSE